MPSLPLCYALLFLLIPSVDACLRVVPPESGIPAIPCKTCADNLIAVTQNGSNPMEPAVTVRRIGCAKRTFVCKGNEATINVFSPRGKLEPVTDQGTGTATLTVTCNAAGRAWEHGGEKVVRVECVTTPVVPTAAEPPCKQCAVDLISKTTMGANSKKMDDDETLMEGACLLRKFTCKGIMASIAVFGPGGEIGIFADGDDEIVDGTSTFTVACNGTGTAWETGGMEITRVECSHIPRCKTCTENQLIPTMIGSGMVAGGAVVMTDPCHTRQFTCTGIDASIAVTTAANEMLNIPAGDDGTATLDLTCNADGSRWMNAGRMDITAAVCSGTPRCKTCTENQLIPTIFGSGMVNGGDIMMTDPCHTRQFTCTGIDASIALTTATDEMLNIPAGDDGTATLDLTCNADGSRWMNAGRMDITAAVCSGTPRCKTCTENQLIPTIFGSGMVNGGDIMMTDPCHTRQFTCTGIDASIAVTTATDEMLNIPAGDDGTATLDLTCNADGSRWMNAGRMDITAAVCSGTPRCKTCTENQLIPTIFGSGMVNGGDIMMTDPCHTRQFTCTGIDASIALTTATDEMLNIPPGDDGTATLDLTCNADGSRWMNAGRMDITAAVCSGTPRCKTCTENQLIPTIFGSGMVNGGDIMMTDPCHTRQFTCTGIDASIAVTTATDEMLNIPAGDDGTATLDLTCNADGSRWMNAGRMDITAAVCSGTPRCKTCTENQLIPTIFGSGMVNGGDIMMTDPCHTRQFTCTGIDASIALTTATDEMLNIPPGDDGTATLDLTCNADGSRWMNAGRMDITAAVCSGTPRCKTCTENQLIPTIFGSGMVNGGDIMMTNPCHTRQFTCTGIDASIALTTATDEMLNIPPGDDGTATLDLTCNADGSRWMNAGRMDITAAVCSGTPRCKTCTENQLIPTIFGSGMVNGGDIMMTDPCHTRQFTCTGIDASIALTTATDEMLNIPPGDDGTATLDLTCNADGSRWMNAGRMDITAAVCSGTPRCKTCTENQLIPTIFGSGMVNGGDIMMTDPCHTRQFTCTGIDASIALTTATDEMLNIPPGDDGTATLDLTCNADGSRWMNAGRMDITAAVCSGTPRCKTCTENQLIPTIFGSGMVNGGDIMMTDPCHTRQFTCTGIDASIALTTATDEMLNIPAGDDGTATLDLTCNADGSRWMNAGRMDITAAVCSGTPRCKTCTENQLIPTIFGSGMVNGGDIMMTDPCHTRQFTCTGIDASIALTTATDEMLNIPPGDDGTATLDLTCNADGSRWMNAGRMDITAAVCSGTPRCKTCTENQLIPTIFGSGMVNGGDIMMTNPCHTRQFTCTGIDASIALTTATDEMLNIPPGDDGTATLDLTCNADGSRWMNAGRMDITAAVCSGTPRCKTCTENQLIPTIFGSGMVNGGDIMMTDPCHTRQFTCTGIDASIALTTATDEMLNIPPGDDGTATLDLTCNADGSRWMNAGRMDITAAVCSGTPRCKTCTENQLIPTIFGSGMVNGGDIMMTDPCNTRQFTCTGIDASIAVTTATDEMLNIPAGDDGTATLDLTCNADGSRWMNTGGMDITKAVCSGTPPCQTCMADQLTITESVAGKMSRDMIVKTEPCHTREFTCTGLMASINIDSGAGLMPAVRDNGSDMASLTVTCNNDARWTYGGGRAVTEVNCRASRCKSCEANQLTTERTLPAFYSGGDIDKTGACYTRTLTCHAAGATLEFKNGANIVAIRGGGLTASETATLVCNEMGDAWKLDDNVLTRVECYSMQWWGG